MTNEYNCINYHCFSSFFLFCNVDDLLKISIPHFLWFYLTNPSSPLNQAVFANSTKFFPFLPCSAKWILEIINGNKKLFYYSIFQILHKILKGLSKLSQSSFCVVVYNNFYFDIYFILITEKFWIKNILVLDDNYLLLLFAKI